MQKKDQIVQKMDTTLSKLKSLFPDLKFRAKQKVKKTKARGWGIKLEQEQSETTFEPIDECDDERS